MDSDRFSLDLDWIVFGLVRIQIGLDSHLIRYGFGLNTDWIGLDSDRFGSYTDFNRI